MANRPVLKNSKNSTTPPHQKVHPAACEVRAEACSSSNHLPEFGFGADFFEEDEVDDFRYVNAGVHHVNRDGDVRVFFRLFEVGNQGFCVVVFVYDSTCKEAFVLRVEFVEAFGDELGMDFVLGEDDGFSNSVSAGGFDAVFH